MTSRRTSKIGLVQVSLDPEAAGGRGAHPAASLAMSTALL